MANPSGTLDNVAFTYKKPFNDSFQSDQQTNNSPSVLEENTSDTPHIAKSYHCHLEEDLRKLYIFDSVGNLKLKSQSQM